MYKEHPVCQLPSDDAVLWRYMGFTKFVSLLEKQALFFSRADLLGDRFEGSVPAHSSVAFPENMKPGPLQVFPVDLRKIPLMTYVNCWNGCEFESEAMWRFYATESDGIAIKTSFKDLKDALVGDEKIHVSKIQYKNYRTDSVPFGNGIAPYLHKRISFQYEEEVRALTFRVNDKDKQPPNGFYHKVDINKLIGEIVVAPLAKDWFIELVQSLANRYELRDCVRKSELSDNPNFLVSFLASKDE